MDDLDKECILLFFENEKHPEQPEDIPHLMRKFFTSCFSYAPLRKHLTSVVGSIPDSFMLPSCLAKVFSEEKFLETKNWHPINLYKVAKNIQNKNKYDLKSKKFKPRMISVLLSGSKAMEKKLENGLDEFYSELTVVNRMSGSDIWSFVSKFAKDIYNVGPNLICDFIKGIGFERFVALNLGLNLGSDPDNTLTL